jgi:DNA topoisomerase-1
MPKNLVIVESPAKARTMSRFLSKDYLVKASVGHVRDLPKTEIGVKTDDGFTPKYAVMKEKRSILAELRLAAKGVSSIYLATDPDREGEAISWHLAEAAGWKNVTLRRVVFHQITPEAVKEAFRHPRAIDMNLVNAQQARRILDRLVGYQLSPLLWKKVQRGLSAGRVQSVALRLVVDREAEITAFLPKEFWAIHASFEKVNDKGVQFTAQLRSVKGQRGRLAIQNQEEASRLTAILEGASYSVDDVKEKKTHQRPAPPFITSTLQQEAWRKLRFSAKKTMIVAQQLYEGLSLSEEESVGLITYMRTDSTHLDHSAMKEAQSYIRRVFGNDYTSESPRVYSRKVKGAQEAHEAIRPTLIERTPESVSKLLSSEQRKLYEIIWKRTLASQMTDAILDITTVAVIAEAEGEPTRPYLFETSGSVLQFAGFRALYTESKDDGQGDDDTKRSLPSVTKGESLRSVEILASQHFTQPLPRFTEASLIKALEENGIGRPSTYAPIISTLLDRNYVTKEQGRVKPHKLGEVVSGLLSQHFPSIMDVNFTAQMEANLDEIASGQRDWIPVLKDFYEPFAKALEAAFENMPKVKVQEPADENCDKCGSPMVIKTGRFGRFISCGAFPDCKNAKPLVSKINVACPMCGNDLLERRSKRGKFYGCSSYPDCNFAINRLPLSEACPECGGLQVAYGRSKAKCTKCTFIGDIHDQEGLEVVD